MSERELWASIEAAGPLAQPAMFDPTQVDDVLQAERSMAQFDRRRAFVADYAWAVPTREAVQHIVAALEGRSVLEVCAGAGLWAKLLAQAGVSIVATDGMPPTTSHYPVERLEAEAAVRRYTDRAALMMCWPPFRDGCAFRALRAFEGDRLVYIGDARFTGDGRLQALLDESWKLRSQVVLPSWPGISDSVRVYARPPGGRGSILSPWQTHSPSK